jgi:hypothetical protein
MQTFMDGRGLGALVQAGRDVASRLAMGQECLILAAGSGARQHADIAASHALIMCMCSC